MFEIISECMQTSKITAVESKNRKGKTNRKVEHEMEIHFIQVKLYFRGYTLSTSAILL